MSFSYDIKTKLAAEKGGCEFCALAELYGILRTAARIRPDGIGIITEHEAVAGRIISLFEDCMGFVPEQKKCAGGFRFEVTDSHKAEIVAEKLHILEGAEEEEIMPFACCRESFLRGAFLGSGSISDPNKNYHLEFDARTDSAAKELMSVLEKNDIHAKCTGRKTHYIVYIKGYEDIAALLGHMGAGNAALEIYSVSIEKEIRNSINRHMNCESANMDKVIKAYGKHMLAIEKIKNTIGFENLPESLCEIAKVRMEYPDESLKELGARLYPPIGKSGVNHRLNRLIEIADGIKTAAE